MKVLNCPECGSPEQIDIRANPEPSGQQWIARCGGCAHGWNFDD